MEVRGRVAEPDPGAATDQAEFRCSLRRLMRWAGYRSLQQLAAGAERRGITMPASTANRALNADKLPTSDFVHRFVAACDGTVSRWVECREKLRDLDYRRDAIPVPRDDDDEPSDMCPYHGLAPFQTSQSDWYFGRERVVAELVGRLSERLADAVPLFVVGPSGAGKSSLLRAGLVPALAAGRFPGSRSWPVLVLTPTAEPLRELAGQVAAHVGLDADRVHEELTETPRRLGELLRRSSSSRVVLIVDQFEEVFTLTGESERRGFLAALDSAAPALVVLGLRADFYGPCLRHPALVRALRSGHLPLGAMSTAEVRDVIEKPARLVGIDVEPGLVEVILADLGAEDTRGGPRYEPGALPLLSHALFSTWQQRDGTRLTTESYRLSGGIHGAIAASAEHAYHQLDDPGRDTARRLLLSMIQIGQDTADTRRRLDRSRLAAEVPGSEPVLEALANRRLVTLDTTTVEITHDALLRAWPRLRDWIDTDRTRLLAGQRLAAAAEEWQREGRHLSGLYQGPRLVAARAATGELPALSREFLAASIRRERHRHRATRWRRLLAIGLVIVVACATVVAVQSSRTATEQRRAAVARQAAYEAIALRNSDPDLAGQLSLAAFHVARIPETRGSLISTFATPDPTRLSSGDASAAVRSVAFSPDGRWLAVGGHDRAVRLFDVSNPERPHQVTVLTAYTDAVRSVAFSPDGRWLATGSADPLVLLWDLRDPARPTGPLPVTGPTRTVIDVAFNHDGTRLAAAGLDRTVRLWDITDHANPVALATLPEPNEVYGVAFGPGQLLASAGQDGAFRLRDLTDPRHPARLAESRHGGYVNRVAFSPSGRILVSTSTDATAKIWNVTDPRHPTQVAVLAGHTAPVQGVAFSPDGRLLATTSVDVTARLWEVSDPAHPILIAAPLAGHTDNVYSVSFNPDGHTLATGSHDGSIRIWETDPARLTTRICAPSRRRITRDEWDRYLPGIEFRPPCES